MNKKPKRARIEPASPEVKRQRVFEIAGRMARNQWNKACVPELAEMWGVAAVTVGYYACEASRLLTYTVDDINQLETYCRWRLREISEQDGPDRVQAIQTALKNVGLLAEKHQVQVSQLPDEELVAQAVKQALANPKWRELFRAELAKYDRALLTDGANREADDGR